MVDGDAVGPEESHYYIEVVEDRGQGQQVEAQVHGIAAEAVKPPRLESGVPGWQAQPGGASQVVNADNGEEQAGGQKGVRGVSCGRPIPGLDGRQAQERQGEQSPGGVTRELAAVE